MPNEKNQQSGFTSFLTNPITTSLLGGIGSYLSGGADRRYREQARGRLPGLESELKAGITEGDINALTPRIISSALPRINAIAGRSAAKFGSRSGLALGKTLQGFSESVAPMLLALQRQRLTSNQANLRTIFSNTAATARG